MLKIQQRRPCQEIRKRVLESLQLDKHIPTMARAPVAADSCAY
jgi:hypothetical protein